MRSDPTKAAALRNSATAAANAVRCRFAGSWPYAKEIGFADFTSIPSLLFTRTVLPFLFVVWRRVEAQEQVESGFRQSRQDVRLDRERRFAVAGSEGAGDFRGIFLRQL